MSLTLSNIQLYRPVIILPIALALLAAAAAILWTDLAHWDDAQAVGAKGVSAPAATANVAMLISHADIPRGEILGSRDFTVKSVTPSNLPRGAVSRAEDADGHMALRSIASGSPILKDALSDQAAQGLSARVPQAYRAYAVSVSEANIAGGFVQAGDRVDLYVTLPSALFADTHAENRDDRSTAALLLQSVEVLAVGVQLKGDGTPQPLARTVTLAISTADLAKLALATRLGSISFAIRNPADTGTAPVAQAELASLAGDTPATASVRSSVPTRARRGVPLYAGRSRSLVPVP